MPNQLNIYANGVDVAISKTTGLVAYLDVDNKPMLVRGADLKPDFWRACTDNDFGANLPKLWAAWNNPSLELKNFTSERTVRLWLGLHQHLGRNAFG